MSQYNNEFLDQYMELVEETESPRVYHIWSALAGVSACLGRRVYLEFGLDVIYPNIYVLLTGSPATRKSTAIKIANRIIRQNTGVKFAPENTGGKYQGLITAMTEDEDEHKNGKSMLTDHELLQLASEDTLADINLLGSVKIDFGDDKRRHYDEADKHCMFVSASEFVTFIGHGNQEFLEFLGKMYDGEPYPYQLKREKLTLEEPLITLLGGTTPSILAEALPPAAIGGGFTSRVIFVYGGTSKHKSISWPKAPSKALQERIAHAFSQIYYNFTGAVRFCPEAYQFAHEIYDKSNPLKDGRFVYYIQRRHTHFLKLAVIFAATRLSNEVSLVDAENAHALLLATERTMPDALGEYGQSPLAAVQQQVLEFIHAAKEPVPQDVLWNWVRRDVRLMELAQILNELVTAKKIQAVHVALDNSIRYIPNLSANQETLKLMDALQTAPTTEIRQ